MKGFNLAIATFVSLIFSLAVFAGDVAITIDDLPFVGHAKNDPAKLKRQHDRFMKVIEVLERDKVPVTGFVVAGSIEHNQEWLLKRFYDMGGIIANHTYSHPNLNKVGASAYIEDIQMADEILSPLMSKPKYFRYPFLATGKDCVEFAQVHNFLLDNGYVIAPVTIDSKDYEFNAQYHRIPWRARAGQSDAFKRRYLGYIWQQTLLAEQKAQRRVGRPIKHIFLLHMNTINSLFMQDIIDLYRKHGYRFIPLAEALNDHGLKGVSNFSQREQQCRAVVEKTHYPAMYQHGSNPLVPM